MRLCDAIDSPSGPGQYLKPLEHTLSLRRALEVIHLGMSISVRVRRAYYQHELVGDRRSWLLRRGSHSSPRE